MHVSVKKKGQANNHSVVQKPSGTKQKFAFVDNRDEAIVQMKRKPIMLNDTEVNERQEIIGNVSQLRKNNKKKKDAAKHKKAKNPALAVTREYGDGTFSIAHEADDTGRHLEHYETPRLFWRGDDRPYEKVLKTGFTSKNERDDVTLEGSNVIKWRAGDNQDDIDPDSGVCVAADIRGAAFFPLDKDAKYIYAVGLSSAINTYAIQKDVEEFDTGVGYEQRERYPYDPSEELSEGQSAIWQYKEYVSHRIQTEEILACYEVIRENFLKKMGEKTLAGMRFKLAHIWTKPRPPKKFSDAINKADYVAGKYADFFPQKTTQYLSYYGIIETELTDVQKAEDARKAYKDGKITVVNPLAGESVEDAYDKETDEQQKKNQRSKNRAQKKRKKARNRK